jgi:hypothetical protein
VIDVGAANAAGAEYRFNGMVAPAETRGPKALAASTKRLDVNSNHNLARKVSFRWAAAATFTLVVLPACCGKRRSPSDGGSRDLAGQIAGRAAPDGKACDATRAGYRFS